MLAKNGIVKLDFLIEFVQFLRDPCNLAIEPKSNARSNDKFNAGMDQLRGKCLTVHFTSQKWCLYHFREKKTNDPSGSTTESCYKLDGNGSPMAFPVSALREYLPTVEDASQRFGAGLAIFRFLDAPKAGGYNCVLRYCGQHGGHWNYIARTSRTASRRLREYDSRSMIAVAIVRPPDTFTERAVGEVELYRTETYEPVPQKDHAEAGAGLRRRRSVKGTESSLLR